MCCVALLADAQTDSQVAGRPESAIMRSAGLWMVGLLAQADDESSRGAAASFGYGIGESTWFSAVMKRSDSPAERADISADAFVLGVEHRFAHVGLSFELEDWGDSGALESADMAASVIFDLARFEIELGYEQRDIDITFGLAIGDRVFTRKAPFAAEGRSFGLLLRASETVRIFYDYRDYDYSRDLAVLPRIQALNRLSGSALTLANSLLSQAHTLAVDLDIGTKGLSLSWGEDISAVDGAELSSIGAALILPVARRIDLELSLGRSDSDALGSSAYAGLGILIYGG
jgi:hypothetical protein